MAPCGGRAFGTVDPFSPSGTSVEVMAKGSRLRLVTGGRERLLDQPSPSEGDDLAALVRAARAGDKRVLRTLLTALGPPMLQVIRRVLGTGHPEIEDALQEATVSLMNALSGFRGDCSTRTFARRIAASAAIDVRRAPQSTRRPAGNRVAPMSVPR
jgi:hypothetical protein